MEIITTNWKKILFAVILIVGIIVGVYLVQTKQIFKSRAFTDINEAFEITDDAGNNLQEKCSGNTCEVESLRVNIRIKDVPALLKK